MESKHPKQESSTGSGSENHLITPRKSLPTPLEAMNSEESWASHHPHTVTPAHRAQRKTLRLGLIFFYLCIYIFIISPTNLDIWPVHKT